MYKRNKLTVLPLMKKELYFIKNMIKLNTEDKILMMNSVVHFEVNIVVNYK